MAMLESLLDDYSLYPSLRIPPLQDPFPDLSAQLTRPSPLEPNARIDVNIDDGTAKLSGRRKALAGAKPIGESAGSNNLRPIQKNPRKRQKLHEHERIADFVQLPQPQAKAKNDKPPPFHPVSVLNELHEPPPSAALFPPITPKDVQRDQRRHFANASQSPAKHTSPLASKVDTAQDTLQSPSSKRASQRQRRKWSEQESEQVMRGLEIYGFGKWKKILNHPGFSFQPGRTPVDLKDHFRTYSKSGKLQSKHNEHELSDHEQVSSPSVPQHPNHVELGVRSESGVSKKGTWTKTEDAGLDKGYKKYGFCWTAIVQDPELSLSQRTGPQVRDRFRTRFPELYSKDAREDQDKLSHLKNLQRKGAWTDAEDADLEKGYQKYGFSWTKILHDQALNLSHKTGAQVRDRFRTRFPSLYGEGPHHEATSGTAPKKKRQKGKQHRAKEDLNNRSSPDATAGAEKPISRRREHSADHSADESEDDRISVRANEEISSSKPSALASGAHNIMGILNSDVEDDQPSSPLRLDGWDANVTLPPLLWEEMATRPMFDLE